MGLDHLGAGAQHQVKGIAENDLRADGGDILGQHGLHGPIGPHRHERRGLDHAPGETQPPPAGLAVTAIELEIHKAAASVDSGHSRVPSNTSPNRTSWAPGSRVINMASP